MHSGSYENNVNRRKKNPTTVRSTPISHLWILFSTCTDHTCLSFANNTATFHDDSSVTRRIIIAVTSTRASGLRPPASAHAVAPHVPPPPAQYVACDLKFPRRAGAGTGRRGRRRRAGPRSVASRYPVCPGHRGWPSPTTHVVETDCWSAPAPPHAATLSMPRAPALQFLRGKYPNAFFWNKQT